jgi:hypothetical protein
MSIDDLVVSFDEEEIRDDSRVTDEQNDADYSKKVQKRISTLVKQKNSAYDALNQKDLLISQLQKQLSETATKHKETELSNIDALIAQKREQKRELLNDGEMDRAEEIDFELMELVASKRAIPQQSTPQQVHVPEPQNQLPNAQAIWLEKNPWFKSDGTDSKSKAAHEVFDSLKQSGYDPDDEDTYRELSLRLRNRFSAEQRPPQPNYEVDVSSRGVPEIRTRITNDDVARMRIAGLDPKIKDHQLEWLKNKGAR